MCIHSKRLVIACASLLLGVVPGSFAQSAQKGPPEPAIPTTASVPALSELPFRLLDNGRVLVKVPVSDYLIGDRATPPTEGASLPDRVNRIRKGGLCLYENPTLPVTHSGIGWLDRMGEYLSDGTALVVLLVDIDSNVALTRVRCVPSKMMDVSDLVEEAQELRAKGIRDYYASMDDFEDRLTLKVALFARDIVPNGTTVATNVTSDISDAFTATRVLTFEVVLPNYSTERGAQWKTFCTFWLGDAVYTADIESYQNIRTIETNNTNTSSLESECMVYERSAWSPR